MKVSHTNTFTEDEWKGLVKSNCVYHINPLRLRLSVRRGIPSQIRGDIWMLLSRSNHIQHSPKPYEFYLLSIDKSTEININKDLQRTFPRHEQFISRAGQSSLFNVLKAYSNYDSEIGYCQGMNFIVGTLLMFLDEEKAFWTLVSIMFDKDWRSLFKEGTPRLQKLIKDLQCKVNEKDEEIFRHFRSQDVNFNMFSKYFLTLFTSDQDIGLGVRVLDRFLSFGEQTIIKLICKVLFSVKRTIICMKQEELMMFCIKEFGSKCLEYLQEKENEGVDDEGYTFL